MKEAPMKAIVFGGGGFVGSHVCDKLSDAGYDVVIYDLQPSPWLRDDQKMIVGDILDRDKVAAAVSGVHFVFNFAGIADIGEANGRPLDTVEQNILGNVNILNACVQAGVKRYVFASSVYVYSKAGGFYRCSKQACELYIEEFWRNYGTAYTILRYGSLYGPRSDEKNAIHRFVKQALSEGRIHYFGNAEALREYIHVEDAALCTVKILAPEFANQNIVLTGHQPIKVGDVLKMIAEMIAEPIVFEFENGGHNEHYNVTPYSFSPKVGKKLAPPLHVDIGQGLLRVIEDVHRSLHPDQQEHHGILIEESK